MFIEGKHLRIPLVPGSLRSAGNPLATNMARLHSSPYLVIVLFLSVGAPFRAGPVSAF
jgi:hypothetical protein